MLPFRYNRYGNDTTNDTVWQAIHILSRKKNTQRAPSWCSYYYGARKKKHTCMRRQKIPTSRAIGPKAPNRNRIQVARYRILHRIGDGMPHPGSGSRPRAITLPDITLTLTLVALRGLSFFTTPDGCKAAHQIGRGLLLPFAAEVLCVLLAVPMKTNR